MNYTKADKIHYLEPDKIASLGVAAGFTTRHEGISRPPYNSLNLGTNTFDLPHNVEGNRSILARAFGVPVERLVTVNQVHGTDLLVIDAPNPEFGHFLKLECDGIVTNQPEVLIGITVADCVPVLLFDPAKSVVAALHAGWKGTVGNISRKGVQALVNVFGSDPRDILAAVGPGIGRCCYEVDAHVIDAFRGTKEGYERMAEPAGEGKWQLDLMATNRVQLLEAGLREDNIETTDVCVSCTHDLFFSYRRDNGETGRQMGFIMLRK